MDSIAVILAAGKGTRMRSSLPKVLHPLLGRPMITYSVASAREATGRIPVVVLGHRAGQVKAVLGPDARAVIQAEQLGTGHAVLQAKSAASGQAELVLVISADMPLLTARTLRGLIEAQDSHDGPFSMLTVAGEVSLGFGRVVRDAAGSVTAVVEETAATPEQLAIREYNVGAYCFSDGWLWSALEKIEISPKGEYYLTDLVGIAAAAGLQVKAMAVTDPAEAIGINTLEHLRLAETELLARRTPAGIQS